MDTQPADFSIPKQYYDQKGCILMWPRRKKRDLQLNVLRYLLSKFESGRSYTEHEINVTLKQFHSFQDWALLRRELFELGWLGRVKDGTSYWRVDGAPFDVDEQASANE